MRVREKEEGRERGRGEEDGGREGESGSESEFLAVSGKAQQDFSLYTL